MCLIPALSHVGWGCRVAVPGQGDPIIAITCISHPSSQATAKAQPAAPAAELQLEGVAGEDEGLEGGLEGDLGSQPSAEEGVSHDTCMSHHAILEQFACNEVKSLCWQMLL